VGIILPLTGDLADFGEMEKQSFAMALEEINGGGGVKGRKLVFLYENDTGKPEVGRLVAQKLITEDKVVMLGGGYSNSVTYAVAEVAQQNRLPFLINSGPADNITEQGWDYVFRLSPPASEYVSGLESFLAQVVKPKTAAIIQENSIYGRKSAEFFKKSCKNLGIDVLMVKAYKQGIDNFKPILSKVKEVNPDIVYMSSHIMDGALLMKQARQIRILPKLFIGGTVGFTLPEFAQYAGIASEKLITPTPWHQAIPLPSAQNYFTRFKDRYNKNPDYHGAEAYAAAYVIKDALQRARSFAPHDIKQSLKETRLMTLLGPVRFTSYDNKINQNKLSTYVVQWQLSRLKLIWPRHLANADYVFPVDWLSEWGY
jgi:branched-chain amino acid transport system substrate-binding protein